MTEETKQGIERSDLWYSIYGIISKLQLAETREDCIDKPSVACSLEELFKSQPPQGATGWPDDEAYKIIWNASKRNFNLHPDDDSYDKINFENACKKADALKDKLAKHGEGK